MDPEILLFIEEVKESHSSWITVQMFSKKTRRNVNESSI